MAGAPYVIGIAGGDLQAAESIPLLGSRLLICGGDALWGGRFCGRAEVLRVPPGVIQASLEELGIAAGMDTDEVARVLLSLPHPLRLAVTARPATRALAVALLELEKNGVEVVHVVVERGYRALFNPQRPLEGERLTILTSGSRKRAGASPPAEGVSIPPEGEKTAQDSAEEG